MFVHCLNITRLAHCFVAFGLELNTTRHTFLGASAPCSPFLTDWPASSQLPAMGTSADALTCMAVLWNRFGCTADYSPATERWAQVPIVNVIGDISWIRTTETDHTRKQCFGLDKSRWPVPGSSGKHDYVCLLFY